MEDKIKLRTRWELLLWNKGSFILLVIALLLVTLGDKLIQKFFPSLSPFGNFIVPLALIFFLFAEGWLILYVGKRKGQPKGWFWVGFAAMIITDFPSLYLLHQWGI